MILPRRRTVMVPLQGMMVVPQREDPHLACFWVLGSIQTHIIDVCMCEVISGGGDADVDLAGQVDQLRVALSVVSNHVVDSCRGRWPSVSERC